MLLMKMTGGADGSRHIQRYVRASARRNRVHRGLSLNPLVDVRALGHDLRLARRSAQKPVQVSLRRTAHVVRHDIARGVGFVVQGIYARLWNMGCEG